MERPHSNLTPHLAWHAFTWHHAHSPALLATAHHPDLTLERTGDRGHRQHTPRQSGEDPSASIAVLHRRDTHSDTSWYADVSWLPTPDMGPSQAAQNAAAVTGMCLCTFCHRRMFGEPRLCEACCPGYPLRTPRQSRAEHALPESPRGHCGMVLGRVAHDIAECHHGDIRGMECLAECPGLGWVCNLCGLMHWTVACTCDSESDRASSQQQSLQHEQIQRRPMPSTIRAARPIPGRWYCPRCSLLVFGSCHSCPRCAERRTQSSAPDLTEPGDLVQLDAQPATPAPAQSSRRLSAHTIAEARKRGGEKMPTIHLNRTDSGPGLPPRGIRDLSPTPPLSTDTLSMLGATSAPKRRRGKTAIGELLTMCGSCGLLGPLGIETNLGGGLADELLARHRELSMQAWDIPRTHTAVRWLDACLHSMDLPTPFRPFVPALGLEGQIHNRHFLHAYVTFIRLSPPMGTTTRGEVVSAGTAASYGSCIHSVRSREAGYDIAPTAADITGPLAIRTMRRADNPAEERKLTRGLRSSHMQTAADAGFDRSSEQGIIDWSGLLLSQNAILRGGEWGLPDGICGDPRRIITFGSFDFRDPRHESKWRMWFIVIIFKIKDLDAKSKGRPTPVCRRHDGVFGSDPLCTYDAIALAWWIRRAPRGAPFPLDALGRPAHEWWTLATRSDGPALSDPFFTCDGRIYTTAEVRRTVRRVATAAGQNPAEFGAKSPRIGGATEYKRLKGRGGEAFIKARGRWASDVALIYQRELVGEQLDASAEMGSTADADMEELCEGWSQPTR